MVEGHGDLGGVWVSWSGYRGMGGGLGWSDGQSWGVTGEARGVVGGSGSILLQGEVMGAILGGPWVIWGVLKCREGSWVS